MSLKILFFGQLADITGVTELNLEKISDRDELVDILIQNYPQLRFSNYAIAVDRKVITDNVALSENSTIALLPPFSGG